MRERRRYGPLGWTIIYDFNDSDFRISMRQLYLMVENFEKVPFLALKYLTGECNYGGKVTDERDRRALLCLLDDFYCDQAIAEEPYLFAGQRLKKYQVFDAEGAREYLEYIKALPEEESPALMGLHENASITQAINEANDIFGSVLKLTAASQSEGGEGAGSEADLAMKMTQDILTQIREPFKIKEVEKKFPFRYEESMNAVIVQELARFNKLIETIHASLNTLELTLDG